MNTIYASYDGALDPLGSSQVVPYVVGLARRGWSITLLTFEKPERWAQKQSREFVRSRLVAAGIRWLPLPYHRTPRAVATLRDLLAGSRAITNEARHTPPILVHCRGDVTAVMARWARLPAATRLLYDMRGFFSDERVEIGSWRRGSLLDRVVRRTEAANLRRGDAIVVLTRQAAARLLQRGVPLELVRVIPTCADTTMFTPRSAEQKAEFGLVYSGSLGTWYLGREMLEFARIATDFIPEPPLFLTPHTDEAQRLGVNLDWPEVRSVEHTEVGSWLRRASAVVFFIAPIPSKRASCPTKFAEGLASGLPIVCNRGIGDLDEIVEKERVGVLVNGFSDSAYRDAARRLGRLLQDPDLSKRCRRLAESYYGLGQGVSAYDALYRQLSNGETGGRSCPASVPDAI